MLLLAECHFHLQDSHGSLRLFTTARELLRLDAIEDDALNVAIMHLEAFSQLESDEGDEEFSQDEDESIAIQKYSRPVPWEPSSSPSNLTALQFKWCELQQQGDGAEQFARFACVTTNELEGVFRLKGGSSKRLARCGFYMNSIVGISRSSRHKHPETIISIVKNTEDCYWSLMDIVDRKGQFTGEFLQSMHRKLLDRDNVDISQNPGENATFHLCPMGRYRQVPCFASHPDDGYETQFCAPNSIQEEMQFFFKQAQRILEVSGDELDPFRATAYLQHALLRIHPFGDGNGRISRLVSSIPLLREGLPPVIVSVESKKQYFQALKVADDTGDIDPLALFLQEESFRAVEELLGYDPSSSPPKIFYDRSGSRLAIEKKYREKQRRNSDSETSSSSESLPN